MALRDLITGPLSLLVKQVRDLADAIGARLRASVSLTIYVNASTGSDSNDGLTSGTALATIQAAINLIKADYDLAGPRAAPIIIQLADGTYSGGGNPVAMMSGQCVGQQQSTYTFPSANEVPISIRGNPTTPANVLLTSSASIGTLLAVYGAVIAIENLEIRNTGTGQCIEAGGFAAIQIGPGTILGPCGGAKIASEHGSIIENYGNFSVYGNCSSVLRAREHGALYFLHTVTISASFTCTYFALTTETSKITAGVGFGFSLGGNTVTGARFAVTSGSSINGTGSNVNFFPGTVAGTVDDGTYDGMRSILGTVAWPTWSPTITADTGTITTVGTVAAAYWVDGKTIHFRLSITITTNGTGAGYVKATLPVAAKGQDFVFAARRTDNGTGILATVLGATIPNTTHMYFTTLTNTYPGADGAILVATGTYEAA